MYFVELPEREKMAYATRVEALRRWFGQETDTSVVLEELAGLRRGKNQSAKELADSGGGWPAGPIIPMTTRARRKRRFTLSKRQ